MENKKKILALFGKSGSGKNTIQKYLAQKQGMNNIIPCTTRPKRENEQDGIDYNFLTLEQFRTKLSSGSMLETSKFNHWLYGTQYNSLKNDVINVGVFNIQGIKYLITDERIDVLPIYIQCPDKIRLRRSISREVNPDCYEICRRFLTDEKDFAKLNFDYEIFDNSYSTNDFHTILNRPMVKAFLGGDD